MKSRSVCEVDEQVTSYYTPAGTHPAELTDVIKFRRTKANPKGRVRLFFTVRVKGDEGMRYRVARTFSLDLARGSDLYSFLSGWLGVNLGLPPDNNGDLSVLIGRTCIAEITHAYTDRPIPFVRLERVFTDQPRRDAPYYQLRQLQDEPLKAAAPRAVSVERSPTDRTCNPESVTVTTTACASCGTISEGEVVVDSVCCV